MAGKDRVYKALKELKRKGEDLKLEKAIEPLREVYARVNPSRRSMFIAQVVYLLTKQTFFIKKIEKISISGEN